MREIKFAWVCRNIHFNEIERVELTDKMLLDRTFPSWITTDNCEVIAKILPTGLKDKNGKEIFGGDIVKGNIMDYEGNFEVIFYDGCFSVQADDTYFPCLCEGNPEDNLEIIGNKFENEDLL